MHYSDEFQMPASGVMVNDHFMIAGQTYRTNTVEHIAPSGNVRLTAQSVIDPVTITLELPGDRLLLLFTRTS